MSVFAAVCVGAFCALVAGLLMGTLPEFRPLHGQGPVPTQAVVCPNLLSSGKI